MKILEHFKRKLIKIFSEEAKVWGVAFESEFPAEFIITQHAEERFKERVHASKGKMMKMAVKAWQSEMEVPRTRYLEYRAKYDGNKKAYFRYFMGYVFIFATIWRKNAKEPTKLLLTVYEP